MKFRKKPVVIDAIQFTGTSTSANEIKAFCPDATYFFQDNYIVIPTLEGDHRASPGDWIIRGVKGEFYPCKPDIFDMTYELEEDPNA